MIHTAFVIINYHKEQELIDFVETCLRGQLNAERHLIIVDNGSDSNLIAERLSGDMHITLLKPGKNLGYFGAAKHAYDYLISKQGHSEIFIVSNFDLEFDERCFLSSIESVCSSIEPAVIGPDIHSSLSGSALNPIYSKRLSLGKIQMLLFVTSFYPLFLFYQWLHHFKRKANGSQAIRNSKSEDVYAVHGSFMIFRRSYFENGGSLNFESFLYGEELFEAEECRRICLRNQFEPSLKIIHREHTTTGVYKNAIHMRYLHQSLRLIRHKYYES
jgi:GT2 family glycosyltransferase